MHEVLVNRLGGLSLPRKSVVRLTDRPDMTLDVYCGRKTTNQQQQQNVTCYTNGIQKKVDRLFSNLYPKYCNQNNNYITSDLRLQYIKLMLILCFNCYLTCVTEEKYFIFAPIFGFTGIGEYIAIARTVTYAFKIFGN